MASLMLNFHLHCFFVLCLQPSATENGPYDYTRSGNPTRDVLERCNFAFCVYQNSLINVQKDLFHSCCFVHFTF